MKYEAEKKAELQEMASYEEQAKQYAGQSYAVAEEFEGGSGTEADPYQIATAEQLALLESVINGPYEPSEYKMATHYQEAYYVLVDDIEMNDTTNFENWLEEPPQYEWTAIGGTVKGDNDRTDNFSGYFDGQGYTISGLYLSTGWYTENANRAKFGLFGAVSGATIKNVTITKSLYRIFNLGYDVGGIAGAAKDSEFINCHSEVKIYCRISNNLAGIVANSWKCKIDGCTFSGELHGGDINYHMAGIASDVTGGEISNCVNKGQFDYTESTIIGGIVGEISTITDSEIIEDPKKEGTWDREYKEIKTITKISNCKNEVSVPYGGGIIGEAVVSRCDLVIENCQNFEPISMEMNKEVCGGLIGDLRMGGADEEFPANVLISNSINTGDLTCSMENCYVGGLLGRTIMWEGSTLQIDDCINNGNLESKKILGGIVGNVVLNGDVEFCLSNSENHGEIIGIENGVGGIVGMLCFMGAEEPQTASIEECINTGLVEGGSYGVGGILGCQLGRHGDSGDNFTIRDCTNNGNVNGLMSGAFVGGIAGYIPALEEHVLLSRCINNGKVTLINGEKVSVSAENRDKIFGSAGQIVGGAQNTVVVDGCHSYGQVAADEAVEWKVLLEDSVGYRFEGGEPVFGFIE